MPTCVPQPKEEEKNIYKKFFLSTHDLMFSGHALFFISFGKMQQNIIFEYFCPIILIISRQHYTVDIFVSFLTYNYIYLHL